MCYKMFAKLVAYNLTLGTTLELEMEYRSDSKNGLLLSFIPNKSSRFPTFSIFLDNGNVCKYKNLKNSIVI